MHSSIIKYNKITYLSCSNKFEFLKIEKVKMDLSKVVFRSFKNKGLSMTSGAMQALCGVLSSEECPESSLDVILADIRDIIDKREGDLDELFTTTTLSLSSNIQIH